MTPTKKKTLGRIASYKGSKICRGGGSSSVGVRLPHLAISLQNQSWWKVKKDCDDSQIDQLNEGNWQEKKMLYFPKIKSTDSYPGNRTKPWPIPGFFL